MKINLLAMTVVAALASTTGVANAKGCLKGAAVGGVAGHVAGKHGVVGAAARKPRNKRHRPIIRETVPTIVQAVPARTQPARPRRIRLHLRLRQSKLPFTTRKSMGFSSLNKSLWPHYRRP